MARDDRFKKAQQTGADWLETARVRAEEFLRELSKAGDSTQKSAQGALDDLIEGSRKGTEQLISSIRSEVSAQLGLLGLATKADLADLERRITGRAPAQKAGATKKAAPKKAPAAKKAAAKKTPGKKAGGNSSSAGS